LPGWFASSAKESFTSLSGTEITLTGVGIGLAALSATPLLENLVSRVPYIGPIIRIVITILSVYFAFFLGTIIIKIFLSFVIQQIVMLSNMAVTIFITLVMEILISITAYKELSTLLGGEPLLFALSRLV